MKRSGISVEWDTSRGTYNIQSKCTTDQIPVTKMLPIYMYTAHCYTRNIQLNLNNKRKSEKERFLICG